jgi:dTDP-glucose pyrophosphorylase
MRGLFSCDEMGRTITHFFVQSIYENCFLINAKGQLLAEFKQRDWRVFCGLGIDQDLPLSALYAAYLKLTPPFKKRIEPHYYFRKLKLTLDYDGTAGATIEQLSRRPPAPAAGLIMAGGFGTRLGEMTKTTPKPMLTIAQKPIARHLVDNLIDNGIKQLYFSLHYLSQHVKDYFQDGAQFGASIRYLEEERPLGTAGCLSLIGEELTTPLLIVNGDVVTDLQFSRLIDFHEATGADVTLSVGQSYTQVPFGVVQTREGRVLHIQEKPRFKHDINLAVYVFSPEIIKLIPPNEKIDMPCFLERLIAQGYHVSIFPFLESWVDIGTPSDFAAAAQSYNPALRPRLSLNRAREEAR